MKYIRWDNEHVIKHICNVILPLIYNIKSYPVRRRFLYAKPVHERKKNRLLPIRVLVTLLNIIEYNLNFNYLNYYFIIIILFYYFIIIINYYFYFNYWAVLYYNKYVMTFLDKIRRLIIHFFRHCFKDTFYAFFFSLI